MQNTLFDKLWSDHAIVEHPQAGTLLHIDRHLLHEGSRQAFRTLQVKGLQVRRPDLTLAVADHYVPTDTRSVAAVADPSRRAVIDDLDGNAAAAGILAFGLTDPRQGIVHVVGPEQGVSLPGLTIVCGDSHTATHGALGALAFGVGAFQVATVLATQVLWQRKPRQMRITVNGRLAAGVTAKDLILAIIARIGAGGATGHAVEYAGPAIRALSMEARMTVCNMSIEAGARFGLIAPDETTFDWLRGRPFAPAGADWDAAVASWRRLTSDPAAAFDREVVLDGPAVEPMLTWGTSPQDGIAITGHVPDPAGIAEPERRLAVSRALDYMALRPGMAAAEIRFDRVFIGSCTNGRLDDLRAAAAVVRGRRATIPAMVVPGSMQVKAQAEAEGLDGVFRDAGFDWRMSGCSMCVGMNGDLVAAGQRCASTSNRNFVGRQGVGARTHLMSPAMAAAAAIAGHPVDIRRLGDVL